jgi:hypothetical protein
MSTLIDSMFIKLIGYISRYSPPSSRDINKKKNMELLGTGIIQCSSPKKSVFCLYPNSQHPCRFFCQRLVCLVFRDLYINIIHVGEEQPGPGQDWRE